MRAPETTSKPRVNCPRGAHLSRLVQIVDLGGQRFNPSDDPSRKLYFGFETCEAKHTFKDENGPEPFMLQIEFAFYMTSANPQKPTKLRQFLMQWFGKDFASEQEAKEFDFSKLLGRLAMLTVAHKPKADGTPKAVIADIYQPEKGAAANAPAAHGKLICYEIENGEDAMFRLLPPFLQKKIKESEEFKRPSHPEEESQEREDEEDGSGLGIAPPSDGTPEDDIPF